MSSSRWRVRLWKSLVALLVLAVAAFGLRLLLAASEQGTAARPTITDFRPKLGGVGTVVRIRGTNLSDASRVMFNGKRASDITVISETIIDVVVPVGATTGSISVAHGATSRSVESFTVKPSPTITALSVESGGIRTHVTITGANLTDTKTVTFNDQRARNFAVISDTELDVSVPLGASTGKISVTTLGGTATSPSAFTVVAIPTVSLVTPPEGGVGTSVRIVGTDFTGATAVVFGSTPATDFTVESATAIVVVVPDGAQTGRISITTAAGTLTRPTFKIVLPPRLDKLALPFGRVGALVTLTGAYLTSPTSVTFNGVPATEFSSPTSHMIKVTVPAGATTGPIEVTTSGGTISSSSAFIVLAG